MRGQPLQRDIPPVLFWVGLLWVYSGILWLLGMLAAAQSGWPGGTFALALRLGATLAIGVGLCAMERWAWAPAVCLAGFYGCIAAGVAALSTWSLVTAPASALSWTPLLWGLNRLNCGRLAVFSLVVAVAGAGACSILWRMQTQYDVPHRRGFTLLVRRGLLPTALLLSIDAYLLLGLWSGWMK
jgi:hypothetical protein